MSLFPSILLLTVHHSMSMMIAMRSIQQLISLKKMIIMSNHRHQQVHRMFRVFERRWLTPFWLLYAKDLCKKTTLWSIYMENWWSYFQHMDTPVSMWSKVGTLFKWNGLKVFLQFETKKKLKKNSGMYLQVKRWWVKWVQLQQTETSSPGECTEYQAPSGITAPRGM